MDVYACTLAMAHECSNVYALVEFVRGCTFCANTTLRVTSAAINKMHGCTLHGMAVNRTL
jgi:hypothetical protein